MNATFSWYTWHAVEEDLRGPKLETLCQRFMCFTDPLIPGFRTCLMSFQMAIRPNGPQMGVLSVSLLAILFF